MLARSCGAASLLALLPLTGAYPRADRAAAAVSPAAAAVPVDAVPGACAASILRRLGLRGRVGQLLLVGVPVDEPGSAAAIIATYRVGSIFLAGRSYRSVRSVRASTDALQREARTATGLGAYVAADQEGGLVQTLRGAGFTRIPSAERQGELTAAALRVQTAAWAAQLRAAGITLDLAPVADTVSVSPASANPPIGAVHRGYGDQPAAVARDISTVVAAVQGQRVATTLKHFPGLGRVLYDPDTSSLATDPFATASDPNLSPFRAGIAAGVRAVMMSSARYPRLDAAQPAVVSPRIVTGLLQQQMGFRGLVVTDDIGAAAALRGMPLAQRAIGFIDAGGQLVLTVRTSDAGPLSRALTAHAVADAVFRRRVDAAALRVVQSKVDAGLAGCQASTLPYLGPSTQTER